MDGEMIYINSTVLAHHGIKGQEWGKRLYQNTDGSLTPLGRLRYRKSGDQAKSNSNSSDKGSTKGKSASDMTDNELRDRINRLTMEKQYKQLLAEMTPEKKSTAKKLFIEAGENLSRKMLGLAVDLVVDEAKKFTTKNNGFDMKAFTKTLKGDINGMDPETIKQVAQWYDNAQKITKGREKMGDAS